MTLHRATYRSNPPYHSPVMNRYHCSQAASTSQLPLSSTDVPDLYYEQGYRTPSSDMLSTPPRHSQLPWTQEYYNDVRENNASYLSSWQSSPMNSCQSKRPIIAPIETSFNWNLHDTTMSSPTRFTSHNDLNRTRQPTGEHCSSYSHTNDPTMDYSLTAMPDSSALSTLLLPPITPPSDSYTNTTPSRPFAATVNQAPLKLHQPRPSRRIPIISLSKLASACDDLTTTHVQEPKRHSSEEALSLEFNKVRSMLSFPAVDGGNTQHLKYMVYPTNDMYSPTYGLGFDGHLGKAILCNCGCMESYTFR